MEKFKNLLVLIGISLFYYLLIAFISWDLGFENWNAFERFIYITVMIYSTITLNSDKK
jgi:hypothetical protein